MQTPHSTIVTAAVLTTVAINSQLGTRGSARTQTPDPLTDLTPTPLFAESTPFANQLLPEAAVPIATFRNGPLSSGDVFGTATETTVL